MIRLYGAAVALLCVALIPNELFSQDNWQPKAPQLTTRWTRQVTAVQPLNEYPRPQMVRKQWTNLNGLWDYAIVSDSNANAPTKFGGQILVPYPVESALSGVKRSVQPTQALWYKRTFTTPSLANAKRLLLHFGAVDWSCTVFINGKPVGMHSGGYDNFSFDITDQLREGNNELAVKVTDPSDKGPNPHGKQVLKPESIWYTPATGIWQTVWLEAVPVVYISDIRITPDVDNKSVRVTVHAPENFQAEVTVRDSRKTVAAGKGAANTEIVIPVPAPKLWSPTGPFLYDLDIRLTRGTQVIDEVTSYAGMRKVEVKKDAQGFDRIFLNNKYVFNLGVLDQGFWPDGIYTAPTDAALKFDIAAVKAMGFNTIRKHIKRESDRWYYWCDRLGVMVWQDMINPSFELTGEAKKAFEEESREHVTELYNHPSITVYTLFNEKWGQYDQERLTAWLKSLDTTRLVNGHSGEILYVNEKLRTPSPNAWAGSDLADIHSYPDPMNVPSHPNDNIGGARPGQVKVLGEFGGIGTFIPDHQWNNSAAWGYITTTPAALKGKYRVMTQHLKLLEAEGLSASIYTQPFDVEIEQNGLMTYDREVVKIPFDTLRAIHSIVLSELKSPASPASRTASTTKPFDYKSVTAKNADITEPTQAYAALFQQYLDRKFKSSGTVNSVSTTKHSHNTGGTASSISVDRDLLRKLVMLAGQTSDVAGRNRFTSEYISSMKTPYSEEDWGFIESSTKKVSDAGFALLLNRLSTAADATSNSSTGASPSTNTNTVVSTNNAANLDSSQRRALQVKLMNIIYQDVIASYVPTPEAKPDWEELEKKIALYGSPGEEIFLRAKTIHTMNQQDWAAYKPVARKYVEKYGAVMKAEERRQFEEAINQHN